MPSGRSPWNETERLFPRAPAFEDVEARDVALLLVALEATDQVGRRPGPTIAPELGGERVGLLEDAESETGAELLLWSICEKVYC